LNNSRKRDSDLHKDNQQSDSPASPANRRLPIVIDVEASGFGRGSYPIEVGLIMPDGHTHCFLIQPLPHWTHWSLDAESMHGIRRETLLHHGKPGDWVATRLNALLAGQLAYTDAWGNDNSWLARLYEDFGIRQQYRLETIRRLLSDKQAAAWAATRERLREQLQASRHRASSDALVLQKTYQALTSRE